MPSTLAHDAFGRTTFAATLLQTVSCTTSMQCWPILLTLVERSNGRHGSLTYSSPGSDTWSQPCPSRIEWQLHRLDRATTVLRSGCCSWPACPTPSFSREREHLTTVEKIQPFADKCNDFAEEGIDEKYETVVFG